MAKYEVHQLYQGEVAGFKPTVITVETDDDGEITGCSEGMDWVKMYTNRYQSQHIDALSQAVAMTHTISMVSDGEEVAKMEGQVTIAKADDELRQVFGWAYVLNKDGEQVIDRSGEFIKDVAELERSGYQFVMESRVQGDQHTKVGVGKMIESMVITPEKIEKLGLPEGSLPTGWWVGFQVDEEHWEEVKKRKQFSIHGKGVKKAVLT